MYAYLFTLLAICVNHLLYLPHCPHHWQENENTSHCEWQAAKKPAEKSTAVCTAAEAAMSIAPKRHRREPKKSKTHVIETQRVSDFSLYVLGSRIRCQLLLRLVTVSMLRIYAVHLAPVHEALPSSAACLRSARIVFHRAALRSSCVGCCWCRGWRAAPAGVVWVEVWIVIGDTCLKAGRLIRSELRVDIRNSQ